MTLKVELKPGERIIVGTCVITNDKQRTRLFIDGDAPILREKDILTPEQADSPAKKIYLAVQLMYLSKTPETLHEDYFKLVQDLVAAAPHALIYVDAINNQILTGSFYKALREAKALIAYEGRLIDHAKRSSGLCADGTDDGGTA